MAKIVSKHSQKAATHNKWMTGCVAECIRHHPPVLFEVEEKDFQRYDQSGTVGVTSCPLCNGPVRVVRDLEGHIRSDRGVKGTGNDAGQSKS